MTLRITWRSGLVSFWTLDCDEEEAENVYQQLSKWLEVRKTAPLSELKKQTRAEWA